jgi:hypothetical protein
MPKIVITHSVENIDRWLQGKQERATALGTAGSNVTDFVAEDGSLNVAVSAEIHDLDALKSLLSSPTPDVLALMRKHGVVPPFTAYIES